MPGFPTLLLLLFVLVKTDPHNWKTRLTKLKEIDWSRSNTKLWEGRAMIGGRLNKAQNNVILTANIIKAKFQLPLTSDEQKIERLHAKAKA